MKMNACIAIRFASVMDALTAECRIATAIGAEKKKSCTNLTAGSCVKIVLLVYWTKWRWIEAMTDPKEIWQLIAQILLNLSGNDTKMYVTVYHALKLEEEWQKKKEDSDKSEKLKK